jgi:hypothetical protein
LQRTVCHVPFKDFIKTMLKRSFATLGILLFVLSVYFAAFFLLQNKLVQQRSITLYPTPQVTPTVTYTYDPDNNLIDVPAPDCVFTNPNLGSHVMSDNESQAIEIKFINETGKKCSKNIEIYAPNFDISPSEQKQTLSLQADQTSASISWILTPRKTGDFEIVFYVSDGSILVLGVNVTNFLGLKASTMQFLSWIGTALGPMLSIPWWYEKFMGTKKKKRNSTKKI